MTTSKLAPIAAAGALALASAAFASHAYADTPYLVVTKDGSTIQGDLVELVPGNHVTLHLATGEVRTIPWADVAHVEASNAPPILQAPPGAPIPPAADFTNTTIDVNVQPVADAGPKAGSFVVDIRFVPVSFFLSQPKASIMVAGGDLGFGERVTDTWYLGVFGGLGYAIGFGGGGYASTRFGGEARYIFNKGTASVSTNGDEGPFYPVPRYDWVSLRLGGERINGVSPHGGFAELALGSDAWMSNSFQFGIILAGGVSVEPKTAYAPADKSDDGGTPPPSKSYFSPFFTLAFHFGFG